MPSVSLAARAEIRINSTTSGDQSRPATVALANGSHVVVWQTGTSNDPGDIRAQRFDAAGNPIGGEVAVNTVQTDSQEAPVVAALADGGYVAAWWAGAGNTVQAQRFDAAGNRIGGEVTLAGNVGPASSTSIRIAGLSNGGYALAWESPDDSGGGVFTRRFDASGQAAGPQQSAAAITLDTQSTPTITGLADGGYVVLWQTSIGGTSPAPGWDVKGQRFDAAGHKVGGEFQVNTTAAGNQLEAATAALAKGGFVVVWRSHHEGDGQGDVYAQRFDASGAKVGGEVRVNSYAVGAQGAPDVVALADGGFAVAWTSTGQDSTGGGIYAQRFDAAGARVGSEFRLNEHTLGNQYDVDLAARTDGGFSAVWTSEAQDGNGAGVFGRSFVDSPQAPVVTARDVMVTAGRSVAAAALVDQGHVQGTPWAEAGLQQLRAYEFTDLDATLDGGYFTVDGVAQAAGTAFTVAADQLDRVRWVAGNEAGNEAFQVRGFDGDQWSAASIGTATATATGATWWSLTAGAEIKINSAPRGDQLHPATVGLADGGYITVWRDETSHTYSYIRAQRFDAGGYRVGDKITVDTVLDGQQESPAVADLADGGYVVAWWKSANGVNTVQAQRFDGAGNRVGAETTLAGNLDPTSSSPIEITGLRDGGYALAWESPDDSGGSIRTQRFDANGQAVGPQQDAVTLTRYTQSTPTITALADGGYVVLWQTNIGVNSPTPGWDVKGQRFDAAGHKVGGEFQVNTTAASDQFEAATAVLADGGFVVVWRSLQEGAGRSDIYAQRFDAAGAKVGGEVHINRLTINYGGADYGGAPDVVGLANGGFVVAWVSLNQDGSESSVYAQQFDAAGAWHSGEVRLNEQTAGRQYDVTLAARPDGGFSAVWTSEGQDGSAVIVTRSFAMRPEIRGTAGVDALAGSARSEIVSGLDGNDHLSGGGGSDWLYGGRGEDVLEGGAGADILQGGIYAMDGDGALDTASYETSSGGVHVYLAEGYGVMGHAEGDRLSGIERVIGSAHADYVTGQEVANAWGTYFDAARYLATNPDLRAAFGTDLTRATQHWHTGGHLEGRHGAMMVSGSVIATGGGDDIAYGGSHDDYLLAGTGNDRLYGRAGHDWLYGEDGDDRLNGGSQHDRLYGGAGGDELIGEDGEDLLVGGAGADIIRGGFDRAVKDIELDTASYAGSAGGVYVNLAEGRGLQADAEGDRLYSIERLIGSGHSDYLVGQETANAWGTYFDAARYLATNEDLRAAFGGDLNRATQHWYSNGHLEGRHGAMMVSGSVIAAGDGGDTVHGGSQDDYLLAGTGTDHLYGHAGNDWLYGGTGDDTLYGGIDADRLYGGLGRDRLSGGAGRDQFLGSHEDLAFDVVEDFEYGDQLIVAGVNLTHLNGTAATSRVMLDGSTYVTLIGVGGTSQFRASWDGAATTIWLV